MEHIYVKFEGEIDIANIKKVDDEEERCEWIEALDWLHASSEAESASGTGNESRADMLSPRSIVFTKAIDAASPAMGLALAQGITFGKITIDVMRIGEDRKITHLEMILDQAVISGITPAAENNGRETERVTLTYQSIKWTYSAGGMGSKYGNLPYPVPEEKAFRPDLRAVH